MTTLHFSIADLIDRLSITLLKHWHLEEELARRTVRVNELGIENIPEEEVKETAEILESTYKLNQYRNKVVEAINDFFQDWGLREERDK